MYFIDKKVNKSQEKSQGWSKIDYPKLSNNKQLLDEVEHDIMRKPNSIIVLLYIYTYNSSSEPEAKRPAILFLRRTLQGA